MVPEEEQVHHENAERGANSAREASSTEEMIDLQLLADKVYQLLCREIRVERARGHQMLGRRRNS